MSGMRAFAGQVTGWDRLAWDQKCVVRYGAQSGIASLLSLLPIPLWRLLRWTKSDKEMPGQHLYGRTYHSLFRHLKYRRIRFLEIGIGGYDYDLGGRPLLAWQAFFPFGTIVACDIEPRSALPTGSPRGGTEVRFEAGPSRSDRRPRSRARVYIDRF